MSYLSQVFTFEQFVNHTHMNQLEENIEDHLHGEGTVVDVFLLKNASLIIDGSASIPATSSTNVTLGASNNTDVFYEYTVRADGSNYWYKGIWVGGNESVQPVGCSWEERGASGADDDLLVLFNLSGSARTCYYKAYGVGE